MTWAVSGAVSATPTCSVNNGRTMRPDAAMDSVARSTKPLTPSIRHFNVFRTIGKQYRRFGQTPWELSFMSCSCAAHYSVWNPLGAAGQSYANPLKGERPWLRRSAQPSWLHLWLSLLLPLHRLQRPKKASPTNKASPYNADPTRRTSRLRHKVRAAISRAAVRDIIKDQKQKNISRSPVNT